MKLLGDVPEKHKKLASALLGYEKEIDAENSFPKEKKAQCYVCLAHDFYQMGADEEGERLLIKADKTFPGYFGATVLKHSAESKDFNLIIKSLKVELLRIISSQLRDK